MRNTGDPFSAAFESILRPLFEEMLENHRAAIRADMRKALAEMRASEDGPDAAAFDTRGAAAYLGVSERTIARMRADGRLPASRIGRQVRFRREDMDAFLAESIEKE